MTSMKLSMGKVLSTMRRKPTSGPSSNDATNDAASDPAGDTPEAIAARCVKQFCESAGSGSSGDEVTFLPPIVEAAESSPAAAAECARLTRKYLHRDYWTKPSYQYNAIMLIRILSDNPGMTFTRNFDKKFVDVAKELLRSGRDASVRQMLMETLDSFENTKSYDEGLALIIEMWRKEKDKAYKVYGGRPPPQPAGPRTLNAPPFDPHSQNYFARAHSNKRLPDPIELTNRLEEARTSAKLLEQVCACTPPGEVLSNDLIKEFADRCLSASRSIQGYMTADDPSPDNDTMENLIDTNEQLQQALNHHQRAVLNARKQLGLNERSNNPSPQPPAVSERSRPDSNASYPAAVASGAGGGAPLLNPPKLPARKTVGNGKGKATELWDAPGPSRSANGTPAHDDEDDGADPFRDPQPAGSSASSSRMPAAGGSSSAAGAASDGEPRLAYEPFHPGFAGGLGAGAAADGGSSKKPLPPLDPVTPVTDDGDEEVDRYSATPKRAGGSSSRY